MKKLFKMQKKLRLWRSLFNVQRPFHMHLLTDIRWKGGKGVELGSSRDERGAFGCLLRYKGEARDFQLSSTKAKKKEGSIQHKWVCMHAHLLASLLSPLSTCLVMGLMSDHASSSYQTNWWEICNVTILNLCFALNHSLIFNNWYPVLDIQCDGFVFGYQLYWLVWFYFWENNRILRMWIKV